MTSKTVFLMTLESLDFVQRGRTSSSAAPTAWPKIRTLNLNFIFGPPPLPLQPSCGHREESFWPFQFQVPNHWIESIPPRQVVLSIDTPP
jgi:hypothetical protein